jgi:hypothetical protein
MKEIYNGLPSWAKGVVVVGGALLGFIVVKSILNKIKATADLKKEEEIKNQAANEIKNLYNQGIKQTIPNVQLESLASEIKQAFDGCGTDTNTLYRSFEKLQNEADLQALIKIYGVRKYDACNWAMDFGDKQLNLSSSIIDECSSSEVSKINAILGKRGIKFRF